MNSLEENFPSGLEPPAIGSASLVRRSILRRVSVIVVTGVRNVRTLVLEELQHLVTTMEYVTA